MEGSGHFMLIGRYKQSGGEKALNQGQMLATVLVRGKNGPLFKQPNLQTSGKRVANMPLK
jgi:hypothetical protein